MLREGDRVLLRVLMLFIVALIAGCSGGEPVLAVQRETYWSIPARQIETSVVLADARWMKAQQT